jgi:hypothetical protein
VSKRAVVCVCFARVAFSKAACFTVCWQAEGAVCFYMAYSLSVQVFKVLQWKAFKANKVVLLSQMGTLWFFLILLRLCF